MGEREKASTALTKKDKKRNLQKKEKKAKKGRERASVRTRESTPKREGASE